jgi:hypothetical protein
MQHMSLKLFFWRKVKAANARKIIIVSSHNQWITKYFFGRHWTAPDFRWLCQPVRCALVIALCSQERPEPVNLL